jgi:phosphotransferase system enzyme I (PtsP)
VQHADPRAYEDVEIEALQTVAMVLSELIAGARLVDGSERRGGTREGMVRLAGLKLVAGMGRGTAVFHQPRVVVEHTVADDPELERQRVIAAFAKMRSQIEHMTREAEFGTAGEHQEILETYKMFAYDEGWVRRINLAIDSGLTAEAAIERVQQRTRARMLEIDDPILKERMHDLEDLSNRLMRIVSGRMGTAAQTGLPSDSVLIDGNQGSLVVRPTRAVTIAFDNRMAMGQRRRAEFAAIRGLPPTTRDGVRATLMVNAGLAEDAAGLEGSGADGIGLFRTEFQFLVSAALPGRDAQYRLYRQVLDSAGDRPVVFRTVDIGGDKALPYLADIEEEAENPAMGWRALRLSLDRSTLMKAQARALIEAAEGRTLRVMFPMISEPWEYEEARSLFEAQVEWVRARRPGPARIEYGAMLEVPSLAEMLDILLPRVDFLSIGTNDLTQFLFAADRGDPRLAMRYDWLSPAILRFLRRIAVQAAASGVPVRVCGEMGGRPLEAMALIGIGITNFSITPAAVGPVKAMIRSLDAGAVRGKLESLLARPPRDMRKALTDWAKRHSIALD